MITFEMDNLLKELKSMKERGIGYLMMPDRYYQELNDEMKEAKINFKFNEKEL
jgi:4-hydroxyphenylpyruvate dioxygenase-like putative hemolysin